MERVPLGDVRDPGGELEQRTADEHDDRNPLQRVCDRADRRPLPQPRVDRPQFRQQQRYARQPGRHVQALGEPVEPHRPGRPREPRRRMLHEMGDQTGGKARPEGDTEPDPEQRGHPRVMQPAGEPALAQRSTPQGLRRRWQRAGEGVHISNVGPPAATRHPPRITGRGRRQPAPSGVPQRPGSPLTRCALTDAAWNPPAAAGSGRPRPGR